VLLSISGLDTDNLELCAADRDSESLRNPWYLIKRMGGTKSWYRRGSAANNTIPQAIAFLVLFIGTIVDSFSTIFGHSVVNGVEEWNGAILTIAHLLPFPYAVFGVKAFAIAIVVILSVVLERNGGPWKMCFIVPGMVWTAVGVLNTITILVSV
jgi:hypothetical protein